MISDMNCHACSLDVLAPSDEYPTCGIWLAQPVAQPVSAVLDTNVLLDIYSAHDLLEEVNCDAPGKESVTYRTARAKDSLLLAIKFHQTRAKTYNLHSELVAQLQKFAPPNPGPENASYTLFTTTFSHFVKDYLLGGWDPYWPEEPDGARRTAADDALLKYAKANDLPLVTNEGNSLKGIEETGLRKKCKAARVSVFTPTEYLYEELQKYEPPQRKLFEAGVATFLSDFGRKAPHYLQRSSQKATGCIIKTQESEQRLKMLSDMQRYYQFLLDE
jgi:hypothetical protein